MMEDERMINDPDNYILGGLIYFNPSDKRIIVHKRNKLMGWTVNFAKPLSYLIIIGIIVFAIIMEKMFP